MVGKPVEIFLAACAQIAADVRLQDFRWLKSKRHLERHSDDVQQIVYFQTSQLNESGRHAAMLAGVNLRSRSLYKWRVENQRAAPQNDWIAGCNLGYLTADDSFKTWNVWGEEFLTAVREVRGILANVALPLFDAFAAGPEGILGVSPRQMKALFSLGLSPVFEWLVQRGRTDLVGTVIARLPEKQRSAIHASYQQYVVERAHGTARAVDSRNVAATIFDLGLDKELGWH